MLIKLYNDKLSELRRTMHRELKDTMQKDVLKGVRWLLLRPKTSILSARNRTPQGSPAIESTVGYGLLSQGGTNEVWEQDDEETGQAVLMDWITYAESSGVQILHELRKRFVFTPLESWPTTTTPSPQGHWKAPTTRSKL